MKSLLKKLWTKSQNEAVTLVNYKGRRGTLRIYLTWLGVFLWGAMAAWTVSLFIL